MFEIDKEAFGKFVAERRKEKGYTQKALAEKLFVSDKAVSKWERGLSMPDISLLMPLADELGISVAELLEGKKMNPSSGMDAGQVEALVKKALFLSEETPERKRERRKRHIAVFGACTLFAVLELLLGSWFLNQTGIGVLSFDLLYLAGMSFGFGIYFWFFIKERLPDYYDKNKINAYSDGILRLHIPGMSFNNSNWPHIVKRLRCWSAVTLVTIPAIWLLLSAVSLESGVLHNIQCIILVLYLAGLFLPLYRLEKMPRKPCNQDTRH